jgi:hypothetical protein
MIRATAVSLALATAAAGDSNLRGDGYLSADASVQQTGIYKDYAISTLTKYGYKECYATLYSSVTNSSDIEKCSGDPNAMVVVGALYGTSATTIKLGGGGLSSQVFEPTASSSTANCYDGVCWYNYPTKSFGFSDTYYVALSPADTYNSADTARMSWNLDNGLGGNRVGTAMNLNSDSTYRKVIYQKTDPLFRIVENYSVSSLTSQGFKLCYSAAYSDITSQDDMAACNKDPSKKVFVGAMESVGSSKFTVGAGGLAGNVFAPTTSYNRAYLANGVYWYNYDGKSFGFAPKETIFLEDADTYEISSNERLSWHVNGQAGGWRAGSVNSLTNDETWRKVMYVQN